MTEPAKMEKTQPVKNCIRFWEGMLFYNTAFLPHETVTLIKATIKHLKGVE